MSKLHSYILTILGAVLIIYFAGLAANQIFKARSSLNPRTFSVTAEGKVNAEPDVAILNFSVITEGSDSRSVESENTPKMNSIINFVKSKKVAERDIQTINFSLNPRYNYPERKAPVIAGYTASQTLKVKVRDFTILGELIAGVVERGANQVGGIQFTIDDPDELQRQAREIAFKKAKEKAKALSKAGSFRVGRLISFSEGRVYFPQPYFLAAQAEIKDASRIEPPQIEKGSQDVVVNLTVVYEIK